MADQYQTSVEVPSFAGLNQSGDGYNQSLRFATDMQNVDVRGGVFAPMRAGTMLRQRTDRPIGTLACLSRRYVVAEDRKNLLVAFSDGKVFTKLLDHDDPWVQRYSGLSTDNVDYVTYEVNREGQDTIDVLLFTNAEDGMFCLYGNDLHVAPVPTPYKFGVLERHEERIWGSGIKDYPDALVYSAPYNPFDWDQNDETPEDGGGEILRPSWDGDSFVALRSFGSQLLCFKKNGIWRVLGTNPGEFVVREQYGGGTIEENTVGVSATHVMMLGWEGLMRYDGAVTAPFQQDVLRDLMQKRLNKEKVSLATAVMRDEKRYMISVPLDGSEVNNAIIEYDMTSQAFTLRRDVSAKAFLRVDDRVFYTSSVSPGIVYELDDKGKVLPVRWYSAYQDLGVKSSVKSAFTLYFRAEAEVPFPLSLAIRTDKKLKKKNITVKPGKATRVNINVSGRFFRLEIESDTVVPFRIGGGIKIDMDLDPD